MSEAKRVLVLIESPPSRSGGALRQLEMGLAAAAFDIPLTVAFRGAGVCCLFAANSAAPSFHSSTQAMTKLLGTLDVYGITEVMYERESAQHFGLGDRPPCTAARAVSHADIANAVRLSSYII